VFVFFAGILYESFQLIVQCEPTRTVNIIRQSSCKNSEITLPVNGCYLDVALKVKISSLDQFLFITNKLGNPVLTAINLVICGLALNLLLRLKTAEFRINELTRLKIILFFIALKLIIQSWMGAYMRNWFSGNPLLNNTGYSLEDEFNSDTYYVYLLWLLVALVLMNYISREIQIRNKQESETPVCE
jgi:hypothetical protein